jgi:MYXO-CTERM domain-containing protein
MRSPIAPLCLALTSLTACIAADGDLPETATESQAIVGGVNTDITQVPWQVSLRAGSNHFCGGTIIDAKWIATAAHCMGQGGPSSIVAGSTLLSQGGTSIAPARVIVFPGYSNASLGKDMALIELATPLPLDGTTMKAIAPLSPAEAEAGATTPGVSATVSGWGTLASGAQSLPDNLQSVEVPIISLQDAAADYQMQISPDQLAAGLRGVGGKDACQGDSGGPLVITDPGSGETRLAGVVSWGEGCADPNYPGMYARVSSFHSFIDDYLGGMPVAIAGSDQTVGLSTEVQLSAADSSDEGFGTIVSYSWIQTLGTPVDFDESAVMPVFTAPAEADELTFELTVTDDRGNTATDTVRIQVQAGGIDTDGDGQPDSDPNAPGDVVGGCAAAGTGTGAGALLLLAAILLVRRRKH